MPTIGVAMAVYNGASTIDAALASIVTQTRRPDEVVVVDDGSSDSSRAQIETWEAVLPLRIVSLDKNEGVAAARTKALQLLNTDLVLALDADDVWLPDHLQLMERAYLETPGLVSPRAIAWHPGRRKPADWSRPLQPPPPHRDIQALVSMNWIFSGALFPRADFFRVGGEYRFDITEDWDLWLRLMSAGVRVTVLEEPTVLYRVTDGSLSADDRGLTAEIDLLRTFMHETSNNGLRPAVVRSLRHRHARIALRRAYDFAGQHKPWRARRAAIGGLRGPRNVFIRSSAMVVAPGLAANRRQKLKANQG